DRKVGHLQRRLVVEDRHLRAPRDDREGDEGRRAREDRRDEEDQLVDPGGGDVLLQRQLERVRDRLQQPKGPGPVRAGPVLHPADHPALKPDHEDRGEQQEHEDNADLEQHQPPDLLVEVAQRRVRRGERTAHSALLRVTRLPWPAPRSARTALPGLLVGSHTTPSAIFSVTSSGTVTEPSAECTITLSPSRRSAWAAVTGEIRATTGRAVAARYGSPSCIRPASTSWCQVARRCSAASWGPAPLALPDRTSGAAG